MEQTKNYKMPLFSDSEIDKNVYDWAKGINGVDESSAMNIIDSALGDIKTESVRELGHLQEHTGKSLDIPDTIAGPVTNLELLGDTRIIKPPYTGKNLLNINQAYNAGSASDTYQTIVSDGQITAIGRAGRTSSITLGYFDVSVPANTMFTISHDVISCTGFSKGLFLSIYPADGSETIYANAGGSCEPGRYEKALRFAKDIERITLYVNNTGVGESAVGQIVVDKLQAEIGTATSYEPYCGAAPAPNPDCPQEIVTAGGLCEWDGVLEQGAVDAYGTEAPMTSRARTGFVSVNGGNTYELRAEGVHYSSLVFFDKDKSFLVTPFSTGDAKGIIPCTFTVPANAAYVRINFAKANTSETLTPSEVSATICPVLRYSVSGKNLLYIRNVAAQMSNNGPTIIRKNQEVTINGSINGCIDYYQDLWRDSDNPIRLNRGQKLNVLTEFLGGTKTTTNTYSLEFKASTGNTLFDVRLSGTSTKVTYTATSDIEIYCVRLYVSDYSIKNTVTKEYQNYRFRTIVTLCDDTAWEPFSGRETIDIPLMDEAGNALPALAEIPGKTRDEIKKDGDTWKLYRNVSHVTIDHATSAEELTNTVRIASELDLDKWFCSYQNTRCGGISSITTWMSNWSIDTEHFYIDSRYFFLFINKNRLTGTTLDEVNAYLLTERPIFYAVLNETDVITLHADAQAALNKLAQTYAGRTIITSLDPLPATLRLTTGIQPDKATYSRPQSDQRYSNALVREADGDLISIHTAEAPALELTIKGKSEQDTTTGKNLYNIDSKHSNGVGIKFVYNSDDTLSVSGTATATASPQIGGAELVAGQTYIYKAYVSGTGAPSNIRLLLGLKTGGQSRYVDQDTPFTPTETEVVTGLVFSIAEGVTCNFKMWGQIEKGNTATAYEPYTGGQPSPNPDYPQPIRSAGGEVEWDGTITQGYYNYATLTPSNTRCCTSQPYIPIQRNSTYAIYSDSMQVAVHTLNANKQQVRDLGWQYAPYTFTTMAEEVYINISFRRADNTVIAPTDVTGVSICPVINVWGGGYNMAKYDLPTLTNSAYGLTYTYDPTTQIYTLNGTTTKDSAILPIDNKAPIIKAGQYTAFCVEWLSGTVTAGGSIKPKIGIYSDAIRFDGTYAGSGSGAISQIGYYSSRRQYNDNCTRNRLYIGVVVGNAGDVLNNVRIRVGYSIQDNDALIPKWHPAQGNYLSIPLRDTHGDPLEPLRDFDFITKKDDRWYISRGTRSYTLDGIVNKVSGVKLLTNKNNLQQAWTAVNAVPDVYANSAPFGKDAYCNRFIQMDGWNEGAGKYFINDNGNMGFYFSEGYFSELTIDAVNDWLKLNNVTLVYRAIPTYEALCSEAQTALNKLSQMYYPQTVITGTDALAPSFNVKYVADSNYIIEQLTNAVIALGGQI